MKYSDEMLSSMDHVSDGSEGAGIYLIQDPVRCSLMNRPHVVQGEREKRPILRSDFRYSIRIYRSTIVNRWIEIRYENLRCDSQIGSIGNLSL